MHRSSLVYVCIGLLLCSSFVLDYGTREACGTIISGGHITENTTWRRSENPFLIEGQVIVDQGVSLVIEAGVEARFEEDIGILVEGALVVNGTRDSRVIFTANGTSPGPGFWIGIRFNDTSDDNLSVLRFSRIEYARIGIDLYSASPHVANNTIINNSDHAIRLFSSSSRVAGNVLVGKNSTDPGNPGRRAVVVESSSNVSFVDNFILGGRGGDGFSGGGGQVGLTVYQSSDVEILNCDIHGGDGGDAGDGIGGPGRHGLIVSYSSDVEILNSDMHGGDGGDGGTIAGSARDGLSVYFTEGLVIRDSTMSGGQMGNGPSSFAGGSLGLVNSSGSIMDSTFSNGSVGVVFHYSSFRVERSFFLGNKVGARFNYGSSPFFNNSVFMGNEIGILCYNDGEGGLSTPSITNSTISSISYDVFVFGGSSRPVFINSTFNKSNVRFAGTSGTISLKWFAHVRVSDAIGGPMTDAYVEIVDVDENVVFNGRTGTDGYIRWIPLGEYTQKDLNGDGDGEDENEKEYFTPHNVSARKYGLRGYATPEPYMDDSKTILVVLNTSDLPGPPELVGTKLAGSNLTDVLISWNLSRDDGSGLDNVDHYATYYSSKYEMFGSDYEFLAIVPSGTKQYLHESAGEGDPKNYFYYVQANTTTVGGLWEEQTAKFTRPLSKGPNLISTPLIQSNESIEHVLQTLSFEKVWTYDSRVQEWKSYTKFKSYSTLNHISHTIGIWISVTEESNLTVAGIVPSQTVIHLHQGWNLVGFPSFNPTYCVSDLKAEVGSTGMEGFDTLPPYYLRILGDSEILQPGYGYWMRAKAETIWKVDIQ